MPNRLTRGNALVGALSIDAQDITISDDLVVGDTANVAGNFSVNTTKFTVAASTGNTAVDGTLGVKGNVAVNTNKFNVTASSGNTAVAGTLGVAGDVAVNTDKLVVTASSGNVESKGTIKGTQFILDPKIALIADPTGGATQDAESRTAIVAIIDALIAAGIVSAT